MRMLLKALVTSHLLPPVANLGLPHLLGSGLPLVASAGALPEGHDQTLMPSSVHSVASRRCQ